MKDELTKVLERHVDRLDKPREPSELEIRRMRRALGIALKGILPSRLDTAAPIMVREWLGLGGER